MAGPAEAAEPEEVVRVEGVVRGGEAPAGDQGGEQGGGRREDGDVAAAGSIRLVSRTNNRSK